MATAVSSSRLTVFKNVCPLDCPDTCSMLVTVEDGVAVELRGDPDHPFTRGFLCQKMARYLERVYSPDRLLHPLRRVGPQGRGPVRADHLGRGARRQSPTGSRRSRNRPTARRRSCPTAITGRWASSSRAASTGGSSIGWVHRSSTGRSAPRPGRSATSTRWAGAGSAPIPMARPEMQVHRQLGLEHRQHQQPSLEPDDRGPQGRRDDRHDRPLPQPDRQPLRLAHPAPPRHRRGAGPGRDARDLARRPPGRRLSRSGDRRRRAAPRAAS